MPITYLPRYIFTQKVVNCLMRIEAAKENIQLSPLTPLVLSSLRETARLYTTHYSTMIEGNRLAPEQIKEVLYHKGHFPGREREEHEVKGYYAALTLVEHFAASAPTITEKMIQTIHALVIGKGATRVKPTAYRTAQNVIRDGRTKIIVYMPPEAQDVPTLMKAMVNWINSSTELPGPLVAAIAHYQYATIHPYYDGNGRTARLLTTFILHNRGYDLKGMYSLEEYYAQNLGSYYEALSIGDSHNYYEGRAEADITRWIEYFIEGMAISCERIVNRMSEAASQGSSDQSLLIRKLTAQQRRALELFHTYEVITSRQISELFGFKPRTSTALCATWVANGFLVIVDPSNKGRTYKLATSYEKLILS